MYLCTKIVELQQDMNENFSLTLKEWADEDKPREKMLNKGKKELTNAELIAILLRSGLRGKSVVEVAKEVLSSAGNSLTTLSQMEFSQLERHQGRRSGQGHHPHGRPRTRMAHARRNRQRQRGDPQRQHHLLLLHDAPHCRPRPRGVLGRLLEQPRQGAGAPAHLHGRHHRHPRRPPHPLPRRHRVQSRGPHGGTQPPLRLAHRQPRGQRVDKENQRKQAIYWKSSSATT